MAKRNDRELKAINTHTPPGAAPAQNAPEHVRRASAMQRILDMKKSYDFWQDLVSKNVRLRLRPPHNGKIGTAALNGDSSSSIAGALPSEQRGEHVTSAGMAVGDDGSEFFSDQDLQFLRSRLDEIVLQNGIQLQDGEVDRLLESCVLEAKNSPGFDPYGADDEEGLHDETCEHRHGGVQDDYDVEELRDNEAFLYDYPASQHRFEVELSDGPPGAPHDPNEPSCEFTFEYDRDGNLIPTSNNIEEKLRLMKLQLQISSEALSLALAQAMALAQGAKRKKKSLKKKKKGAREEDPHVACSGPQACMFCQYEDFYGTPPVHFMRRQDFTHKWEMERRRKFREKLETAKLDARARHGRSRGETQYDYELEGSNGTVEDD